MNRLTASLLLVCPVAAAAQEVPAPPQPERVREMPPEFICSVSRETPLGTIGAQRSVSPSGAVDPPLFSWSTVFGASGMTINASWSGSRDYSFVQLYYGQADPRRTYHLRVEGLQAEGQSEFRLDSGPVRAPGGGVYVFTRWGTLTATLAEAYNPRLVLRDDRGRVVRSEPMDAAIFDRARDMAMRLEPELAPLVADFRNLCRFFEPAALPARRAPVQSRR
jgi:hypothetical protein